MSSRYVADPNLANHFKTMVLQRVRSTLNHQVSREFLDNLDVNVAFDVVSKQIAAQVVYDVYGRQAKEQVVEAERVPATWVDAVKERFFDHDFFRRWGWLAKLTRPHYRSINKIVKIYHMCPHVNVRYDTCRGNLHIAYLAGDATPSS